MVIPFKSIRYQSGRSQIWGVNMRRAVRAKNETSFLSRVPAALQNRAINKFSSAATMVGIEAPPTGVNLEIKPYGISNLTTNRWAAVPFATDLHGDLGVDVKYGVTQGLTADFTYNTDFAQVEEDQQQANLTRFSVLFPEKRDFFLEGQGIFAFGGASTRPPGGGGNNFGNPIPADVPVMF